MLPRERVLTAMNLGSPDQVPLMCQFSIGHMLLQLEGVSPAEFWFDPEVYSNGLLFLRQLYDFDGILISLHGHNPRWRDDVKEIRTFENGEIVEWKNGDVTHCIKNDLPVYPNISGSRITDVSEIDMNGLPAELDYIPVSQNLHFKIHPQHKFDVINKIIKVTGDRYSIHGEITSPLDYFLDLTGTENGLIGLVTDPDKCKSILQHFTILVRNLAMEMCDTGIDAVKLSSPFAGAGLISPDHYAEFVLPYEKEIASAVRKKGVHIYAHTCGAINDRLELIMDTGISGIECLDPAPLGDVELEDAFERIKGHGFIKGNIDSVNSLLFGTEDLILNDARQKIEAGKKYGGFILSTACSIAPAVKRENIMLLRKAIDKWGK
jgi:hypothetical protein